MLQLDDTFLAEVGLADLPAAEKQSLLRHLYEELELRVGARLSDGLRDDQLVEFEAIIDRDHERIVSWLDANVPDFLGDALYQRMASSLSGVSEAEIVCEYVSTKCGCSSTAQTTDRWSPRYSRT